MSRLQQIQVMTQQVAEAISSVLGMDVTVVDESLARIAGTGFHSNTIGEAILGNHLYKRVITYGEELVILDVPTHHDCEKCKNRVTCMELAQLCCPIVLGKETIGVIALVAFSVEQQQYLQHNTERLLTFIRKMAELIVAKAAEKENTNRLLFLKNQVETVLNFVPEGVLAIGRDAKIININHAAEKMLKIKAKDALGFAITEFFFGGTILEVLRNGTGFMNREIQDSYHGQKHHYIINAKPMLIDGVVEGVVATLRPVGEISDSAVTTSIYTFGNVIGNSRAIEMAKAEGQRAADCSSNILLRGESGTGKEVFARAIHGESHRGREPFVVINCAAIPENLLESELFGYEEGSFTGARKGGKSGKFQLADKGTLFLDEIGDMPLSLQAKMLRVLQEKVIERIGGTKELPVDVRIIAATHRNLEEMARQGQFRQDLYYRLNVFPVLLPPLRERREDITTLVQYFLKRQAEKNSRNVGGVTLEAMDSLQNYDWPGNVRELENAIEYACNKMTGAVIDTGDLPSQIKMSDNHFCRGMVVVVDDAEKTALKVALEACGYSLQGKKQAAASLGIGIATLYRKMRKYELDITT